MRPRGAFPGLAAVAVLAAGGCGTANGPAPGAPEPIAWIDTLPVPPPEPNFPPEFWRVSDAPVIGGAGRLVGLRRWFGPEQEAVNLTRFDDVVSSSWFERRNGYRDMTPEEVARGPVTSGPDTSGVLRIVGLSTGRTPGFTVEDDRGDRFLLKFDPPGYRHLATAADVISSRLLWAAGYHTPENSVFVFDPRRLALDPSVMVEVDPEDETDPAVAAAGGNHGGPTTNGVPMRPVRDEDLWEVLERIEALPDGRLLAVASRILPGVPLGPFRFEGRREDDPNDYYLHEYRRELRGLYVVAAWLNHVELNFSNTLDTYVEPGYVRHHLIDFGETLGSGTLEPLDPGTSRAAGVDVGGTLTRLLSLGFLRPAWKTVDYDVPHPSIGWMQVEEFDPGAWTPRFGSGAFARMTDRDGYWGAKLVAAFDDDEIRAAVTAGRFSDPAAADTLAEILSFRRDRIVEHWYGRITPIEEPRVEKAPAGGENLLAVSFLDLGLRDGTRTAEETVYEFRFQDPDRGILREGAARAAPGRSRQTIRVPSLGTSAAVGPEAPDPGALLEVRVAGKRT
ncbi:MAG: hypothetical protein RRA92_10470, partial [Gemmatimonadota bacterium]|nr:hypothetical protein [Gemmatimonadota bacterium]